MLRFVQSLSFAAYGAVTGSKSSKPTAKDITSCDTVELDSNESHYYLGYREGDHAQPWAKHLRLDRAPLSEVFKDGLLCSPYAAELGVSIADGPRYLERPGYLPLENGWTTLPDGTLYIAALSDLGDVTGEMLDFWFYWHVNCSSKYKLWNPEAHRYAWIKRKNLSPDEMRKLPYRERYWDTTSWVNEYIGNDCGNLSIGFFDPRLFNYSLTTDDSNIETVVMAFVKPMRFIDNHPNRTAAKGVKAVNPFQIVIMHQLRLKPDGSGKREMRSRFWIGDVLASGQQIIGPGRRDFGADMAVHCHIEMTNLGRILPGIYEQFKHDIW